jgi:hypothetical protein
MCRNFPALAAGSLLRSMAERWDMPSKPSYPSLLVPVHRFITVMILSITALFCCSQTAAQTPATMIAPADGATQVDPSAPFSWTAVSGAQAYYLYVGTSVGAKDVFNSGSTTATAKSVPGLATGTTYHIRLWTEFNGVWNHFVDSVFTTGFGTAHLTYPLNGQTNTDPFLPFTWSSVPTAQSYALAVGTTPGSSNVFNGAPTSATTATVPGLQPSTTYYTTLSTQFSSGTLTASTTFTTGTGLAHLITPANGAVSVNPGAPFTWNAVSDAQAYDVYVGTTVGAQNVWVSNAVTTTSVTPSNLQAGALYFVRLWTEKSNTWNHVDTSFTTGSGSAHLTYPTNGATNIDPYVPFTWTTIANAQSYSLWVGTSVGTSNVYNSGPLTTTSQVIPGLLQNTTYDVRLFTQTSQGTSSVDTSFTTGLGMAHLIAPAPSASAVDPFQPFSWNAVPGAQFYYLWVGTAPGLSDIVNTATISPTVTSMLVPGLLGGKTYYALMWTFLNNKWFSVSSSFSTAPQPLPSDANAFRTTVQQQTANVRLMTQGVTNTPTPGTLLAQIVAADGNTQAFCGEYAKALGQLLLEQRISARLTTMTFDGTSLEAHVTTEYWDPFLAQWITADPTFGIVYWNPSTTTGLSIATIASDVAAQNWATIQPFILYITANRGVYSHNYYMDPILLYLNPAAPGQGFQLPLPHSPTPYFTAQSNAVIGTAGIWVFSFVNQTDSLTVSDPVKGTVTLGPLGGTIYAGAVTLAKGWSVASAPAGMQILKMNRYLYF